MNKKLEFNEVLEIVFDVSSQILRIPVIELNSNAHIINDLNADSIAMLKLRSVLEQKFDILIPKEIEISTLGNITKYIYTRKEEASLLF